MISIGIVYHGPEHDGSVASKCLNRIQRIAIRVRGPFPVGQNPAVNVVFYVPGSLGKPDWDWLRDAKFSRKRKLLMVQVAVPEELVDSPELEDFAIESLHGANAVAFHYFQDRGIDYPLREAEALVRKIRDRLKSDRNGK